MGVTITFELRRRSWDDWFSDSGLPSTDDSHL